LSRPFVFSTNALFDVDLQHFFAGQVNGAGDAGIEAVDDPRTLP